MHILERIREESQLVLALNSLPRDLDDVYIRLLGGIPEADRPFVRRVLLWIAGHASCDRLRDQGIHIDTLLAAVCDDLQHGTGRTYRYTTEDLQELCGCLITTHEAELPFDDFLTDLCMTQDPEGRCIVYKKERWHDPDDTPKGYFVRIAHYTVMEFLASDRIITSPAQWCSLAWADIEDEFFRSVLRQALAADPTGSSVDWVRDREPYCLTLVPLIIEATDFTNPELLAACAQYFLPTSAHYSRLCQIQGHLLTGCRDARSFCVAKMPVYDPRLPLTDYQDNDPNAWAIIGMLVSSNKNLAMEFIKSVLGWGHDETAGKELLITFLEWRLDGTARFQTYRATVMELDQMRYGEGGIFTSHVVDGLSGIDAPGPEL